MRVLFKSKEDQKYFFSLAKGTELTWKQLYHRLVARSEKYFTFRSFQNWYKALWSPTLEAVNAICKLTRLELRKMNVRVVSDNWGAIIGGKKKFRIYGCQLTSEEKRRAGKKTGSLNTREHLTKISSAGGVASVKSKRNFRRKVVGPQGEKMFNKLEREVAEALLEIGVSYNYEKVFHLGKRCVIPDFVAGNAIIECTYDTRIDWKTKRIIERSKLLLPELHQFHLIVVTTKKLKPRYRECLNGFAPVLTPPELDINVLCTPAEKLSFQ